MVRQRERRDRSPIGVIPNWEKPAPPPPRDVGPGEPALQQVPESPSTPPRRSTAVSQHRNTAAPLVTRSYVLDADQDLRLRRTALRRHQPIAEVVRDQLDQVMSGWSVDDLMAAGEPPIRPGVLPARTMRRTLAIRSDQDELLRHLRVLFGVQASDVVRQAIAGMQER